MQAPAGFTCRPMQSSDLPTLAELLPEVLGGNWSVAQLQAQMDFSHEFLVFTANTTSPETLAGFAEFYCVLDECHLLNFAIFRQWQRQGLAQLFMRELLQLIQNRGSTQCLLEVRRSNQGAVRLYEKTGFSLAGVRRDYYPPLDKEGEREDALLYSWSSSVA
jgi:[ribosomal protein S18]-alanine N-acetyltransferase